MFNKNSSKKTKIRIISGKFGSQTIQVNHRIKSTTSRIVKSLFDILGSDIIDRTFLDCFGGSGRIGIEAISRGASMAIIIEKESELFITISENIKRIGGNTSVLRAEIYDFLANYDKFKASNSVLPDKFDYIFIDPPYSDYELYSKTISIIMNQGLLSNDGTIIIEHNKHLKLEPSLNEHFNTTQRGYGTSILTFLTLKDS